MGRAQYNCLFKRKPLITCYSANSIGCPLKKWYEVWRGLTFSNTNPQCLFIGNADIWFVDFSTFSGPITFYHIGSHVIRDFILITCGAPTAILLPTFWRTPMKFFSEIFWQNGSAPFPIEKFASRKRGVCDLQTRPMIISRLQSSWKGEINCEFSLQNGARMHF
jgi:hypothetical protein